MKTKTNLAELHRRHRETKDCITQHELISIMLPAEFAIAFRNLLKIGSAERIVAALACANELTSAFMINQCKMVSLGQGTFPEVHCTKEQADEVLSLANDLEIHGHEGVSAAVGRIWKAQH